MYEGGVRSGKYHGIGTHKSSEGLKMGLWRKGQLVHGKVEYADGFTYEGNYENSAKCGYAKLKYPNGDYYQGYFVNNDMEGTGLLKFASGSTYKGTFKKGKQNG